METEEKILMKPKCDNCVKGQHLLSLSKELKTFRVISAGIEMAKQAEICFQCIYCKIGKRKAKLYKKISSANSKGPQFQSLDLFEPVKK